MKYYPGRNTRFSLSVAALIAALAALTTGCAPAPALQGAKDRTAGLADSALSGAEPGTSSDSEWSCPYNPNVRLVDYIGLNGYDYSGSESFTVCHSRTKASKFKVTSNTDSRFVCVFPMAKGHDGATPVFQWVDDPQCFATYQGAVELQFDAAVTSINFFIVVDYDYFDAEVRCLNDSLSGSSTCPARAEGFVK